MSLSQSVLSLSLHQSLYICYIWTLDRAVNQVMHLCKEAEVGGRQTKYNQGTYGLSQLEIWCSRVRTSSDIGLGPSVTNGWAAQPNCEKSAAMVRRTWGQYVAVCPISNSLSHSRNITLSRIKWEVYFYKEMCSFVQWSSSLLSTIFSHIFVYVYVCGYTTYLSIYLSIYLIYIYVYKLEYAGMFLLKIVFFYLYMKLIAIRLTWGYLTGSTVQ